MQKLRPFVLPGLLMFHLVVLCVTLSTVSRENETSQQVTAVIIVSQFFLTALFAGMGSGAWTLRIPSWGALAALSWLSFVFLVVHLDGGPPRNAGLWRVPLLFLIAWIVTVTLLLLLRVIPVLQWRVVSRSTLPCSQPRRDSVTRGILVVVATWGGVLMMLKDSYPWSPAATAISKSSDDLLSHVGIAAFVGVGALVVGLLAMSLGLTRFADWMFYRRRWTLPVLVNLVTCAAIILLLSFGGPFKTGPERLLAALWLLPALATQPLTTLLIMGMAGYRLTARKQSEHHVSGLPSQATATITEKPVENWFLNLQRPHIAALVVALLFFVGYVPTGALNQVYITIHSSSIGRNDAGEITGLTPSAWATDDSLRVITGLPQLKQLTIGNAEITDAGLVHLKRLTNLEMLSLPKQTTNAGLVHLKAMTNLQSLRLGTYGSQITDAGLVHLKGLTRLQELSLWQTQITDAGLVHLSGLTNLQALDLANTQVTDGGLVHLKGLNLNRLSIPDQAKTDTGLKHYLAAIEPPTYLDFEDWKITDGGLVHLKGLNLNRLSIPDQAKTDTGLKHYLAAMERPLQLDLTAWKITEAGLVYLNGLTSLQELYLYKLTISDAGLVHLKGLSGLRRLGLNGPIITDAGLTHLVELTNLTYLRLNKTQVTDAGIAELQKVLPNCEIKK